MIRRRDTRDETAHGGNKVPWFDDRGLGPTKNYLMHGTRCKSTYGENGTKPELHSFSGGVEGVMRPEAKTKNPIHGMCELRQSPDTGPGMGQRMHSYSHTSFIHLSIYETLRSAKWQLGGDWSGTKGSK